MPLQPIVQIYEIQTPAEARAVIDCGVDHIGSVITDVDHRHDPILRNTIRLVREKGAVSSLIPLYSDMDAVFDTLAYYRPDIIHFCEQLDGAANPATASAIALQAEVRRRFPGVKIMRAIPIAQNDIDGGEPVLALAARFEPLSDFFLTDTVVGENGDDQPEAGFVGITGLTCDWSVAARLVAQSNIPVILAGGIAPENVVRGIETVRPYGVDSCTCTNAVDNAGRPIRFKKDLERVRRLVAAVRGSGYPFEVDGPVQ
ncbi:phosphoribosylanthranilate isomerase [Desulfosarcina ovata]|nr:hypothetical protein [Desulfosarcina ovata]